LQQGIGSPAAEPAPREHPADSACQALKVLLPGLTGFKESITAAAAAAIAAGEWG